MESFDLYLQSSGKSDRTVVTIHRNLCAFFEWSKKEGIEPEFVTLQELMAYIQFLKRKEVKQRTIQIYLNAIQHYLNWSVKRGFRDDNPAKHIEIKGVKRHILYNILSIQELENMYQCFQIPDEKNDPNRNRNWFKTSFLLAKRNRVILGLMIWQGMGAGELSKLLPEHVQLREGKIYVPAGRRSNDRVLKLEAHQVLDLMEYSLQIRKELLGNTGSDNPLFIVNSGVNTLFNNIMQDFSKKLRNQYPQFESIQQIRASVITHWLKHHNLREVQYRAGHRFVSSTERYLINDLEDLSADIDKFHPI